MSKREPKGSVQTLGPMIPHIPGEVNQIIHLIDLFLLLNWLHE